MHDRPMKTLSPADPSPSVAVEGVSLFLDFPAELVGAVAGDSVLSLLTAEVASLSLLKLPLSFLSLLLLLLKLSLKLLLSLL